MRKIVKDNPNKGLSFLYNTAAGRIFLNPIVKSRFISNIVGKFMDSKLSKIMIKSFIKNHNINMSEYEDKTYISFNDFFTRNIKKNKRPIDKSKNSFIAPCDSKLTCYKINNELTFKIKNSIYSVESIINDKKVSKLYNGGYALVFRLSPEDYHHYAFSDDGTITRNYKINGRFHTVNPIVYDKFEVFKENTRECTLVDSVNFGKMMYVEVGALLVGKINNVVLSGSVKKGQEKGYFMYGGSTVVVLIEKDKIIIDEEIENNSSKGLETCVKFGEKIGKK